LQSVRDEYPAQWAHWRFAINLDILRILQEEESLRTLIRTRTSTALLRIWKSLRTFGNAGIVLFVTVGCLSAQSTAARNSIPAVGDSWPTYNGDYSGRRYSKLTQINKQNVRSLKLAWAYQTHATTLKSTPLEIGGILYFTVPDRIWAVDAKTGEKIWEFHRSPKRAPGHRGVAFYQSRIYFTTSDAHLLCLDARNGKVLWDVKIAEFEAGYYLSVAPLIVKGLVVLGTSGDSQNVPHFIEALDWKTGKIVWRTSTLPNPGTPASRTWPDRVLNSALASVRFDHSLLGSSRCPA
jgi:alcohol dehydrogenase (cytochrome c)